MPFTTVETGRVADHEVLHLFEEIMNRWSTNSPLMAVGGFSYSYPSEEWRRAIEAGDTAVVTSATISARDAGFTVYFRRHADPPRCEVRLLWRDDLAGADAEEDAEGRALLALVRTLGAEPAALLPPRD